MDSRCPICRKPVAPPDDGGNSTSRSYFPFCSERCKLIDLGRWLDGKYQIPVEVDHNDPPRDNSTET
jgi:endogenous inhibitor of DNA gyrase (YacG/DUF329 family)